MSRVFTVYVGSAELDVKKVWDPTGVSQGHSLYPSMNLKLQQHTKLQKWNTSIKLKMQLDVEPARNDIDWQTAAKDVGLL